MHRDVQTAVLRVDDRGIAYRLNEKQCSHLPLSFAKRLDAWLVRRGIPATRQGLQADLAETTPMELMLSNLGLSLTDNYWLKPLDTDYSWEDVNLYQNDFRDRFSLDIRDTWEAAKEQALLMSRTNFIPSASLQGDLKKKWLIDENGIRFLVKGNYSDGCIQSLSEVLATEIHRRQGKFPYTTYRLLSISSAGKMITGCCCENFTQENREFVSAYDIVGTAAKQNDMNYFEHYLKLCAEAGMDADYMRDFLDYQILADFVLTNTDRHLNNFGILRNPVTLRWLEPAPIFDSGNSMFYKNSRVPSGQALLDIEVTSFYSKETRLLSLVRNRGALDTGLLPTAEYVDALFEKDTALDAPKREQIVAAYCQKIRYLTDFQNGARLWSYQYKG